MGGILKMEFRDDDRTVRVAFVAGVLVGAGFVGAIWLYLCAGS